MAMRRSSTTRFSTNSGGLTITRSYLKPQSFCANAGRPSKEGLAIIRRWRLNGRTKPASVFDLSTIPMPGV